MKTTTDVRTITSRHIALDGSSDSSPRRLARVLGKLPDGTLRLQLLGVDYRSFYKDGVLYCTPGSGRVDLGAFDIVWQGRLPGNHPRDMAEGLRKVARRIAEGASGIVTYDEMPVTLDRGTLRTIADALALSGKLGPETRTAIEAAYRAAA